MDFALQASGDYATVLAAARWAEDRGLAAFALPDHYLTSMGESGLGEPAYDNLALLAALARDTASIRLAVLVSPITFRHPVVLAKTGFTIDALSGGRFSLGIGTGWMELEHEVFGLDFPSTAERFERMEEALAFVRAMMDGNGFEGRHYRLAHHRYSPVPSPGFGLVVGGVGARRTPELAGRYADEYNVYPAPADEMRQRIDRARRAAADAGRDPDALLISSSGAVLVGRDEDDYRARFAALAAESGVSVEQLEAHFAYRKTPRGPAEAVRRRIAEMAEVGVSRFYVQTIWSGGIDRTEETFSLIGG
jgi:alkanesulfonate monooxygenase SsuD/methylene tetrahydromethanopterin reductase-like flavin-dependent oxidoreductase (luciferase family)